MAVESADIALMGDNLLKLPEAISLARRTVATCIKCGCLGLGRCPRHQTEAGQARRRNADLHIQVGDVSRGAVPGRADGRDAHRCAIMRYFAGILDGASVRASTLC